MAHLQIDTQYFGPVIVQAWPVPTDENKVVHLEIIHDGSDRDHHIVGVRWDRSKVSRVELNATIADYKDMYGDIA